jgi:ABC-2 type transport system ATP-binding protein
MKQKVALARALMPDSSVLFMDEPQRSLDILFVSRLKELIKEKFGKEDRTIFLCSHDMHFIEETCDRVAVINKGRIVKTGKIAELKLLFGGFDTIAYTMEIAHDSRGSLEVLAENLSLIKGVEKAKPMGTEKIEIHIEKNCLESVNRILQMAMDQGYTVLCLARAEAGLEEALKRLLGEGEKGES